ncbi:MAG: hypothetical protein J6R96_00315 [Spirochaetaceae bacterium]|nr:hypothetical protein [Spirochaetaceae bacterium]
MVLFIDTNVLIDFLAKRASLQEECACSAKADYIVTRNKKDFSQSRVTVVTPEELVALAE